MRFWRQLAVVSLLSATSVATDIAVLRNGFTIRHEKREPMGEFTRLYTSAVDRTSFVDIRTADVERFEKDDTPTPAASSAAPPRAPSSSAIADAIGSASDRYRLDPDFVSSVVSAESGFNSRAVSRKGAMGLMQLMPRTASQLGVDNPFDPAKNAEGGTHYLRILLERYNFDVAKALAAYNAGPARVEQHHGVPPYLETRQYVARIIRDYNRKKLTEEKRLAHKAALLKIKSRKATTTTVKTNAKSKPNLGG